MTQKKANPDLLKDLKELCVFCEIGGGLRLRTYQIEAAQAVIDSVLRQKGLSFTVMFPRQSGKNELQAQVEAYLLVCLHRQGGEIVKISPTWKPQSLNAMRRLERVLKKNLITLSAGWQKEQGYIYRVGQARIFFLSGAPESNIVGATASTLLEVDEAQDVEISKYDKDVNPMAASTNATRVFWGTAWNSQTLLAREMRAGLAAEQKDGVRRVWRLTADQVGAEVAAYSAYVADQVSKLGRNHPLVKTQFYSEEIDAEGGMFPPARRALMQGSHAPQLYPLSGHPYALLLDVAGEDEEQQATGEAAAAANTRRDATVITVVEVDLSTLQDPIIKAPTYKTVHRRMWIGIKQTRLYADIRALVDLWRPVYLVVDATGIGAGLSSFLGNAYPGKVLPFIFTVNSKSQLGWGFLAVIESGRYKEHSPGDPIQALFWHELEYIQLDAVPGPDRRIKWGAANGLKVDGEYIHDDLVLSAALCAVLDHQSWNVAGPALIVTAPDPLKELDHGY